MRKLSQTNTLHGAQVSTRAVRISEIKTVSQRMHLLAAMMLIILISARQISLIESVVATLRSDNPLKIDRQLSIIMVIANTT